MYSFINYIIAQNVAAGLYIDTHSYKKIILIWYERKAYTHDDEYYYEIVRDNIRKYRKAQKLTSRI